MEFLVIRSLILRCSPPFRSRFCLAWCLGTLLMVSCCSSLDYFWLSFLINFKELLLEELLKQSTWSHWWASLLSLSVLSIMILHPSLLNSLVDPATVMIQIFKNQTVCILGESTIVGIDQRQRSLTSIPWRWKWVSSLESLRWVLESAWKLSTQSLLSQKQISSLSSSLKLSYLQFCLATWIF